MSAAVEETALSEPLYRNPHGLYPFQAEGVARAYLSESDDLVIWDTGTGKTHFALALSALLFEDGEIDHTVIVAEKNKVDEWVKDYRKFTAIEAGAYQGAPAKRERLRQSLPPVIVSTYETFRNDLAVLPKSKQAKPSPGPLLEHLKGQRTLIVYDECSKIKSRSSANHRAHAFFVKQMREHARTRVVGLTATPIERDPEDFYNLGRIVCPEHMPTVAGFEADYILARDIYGRVRKWRNLTPEDAVGVTPFSALFEGIVQRKRKSDPDVVAQFPRQVEEFSYVPLRGQQAEFYRAVRETFEGCSDDEERRLFTVMRQIAAHPASLTYSQGQMAQDIVAATGAETLWQMGSAKVDRLLAYLEPLVKGQGAQVVVFTFFASTVLPILHQALTDAGYSVAVNHGGVSNRDREAAKDAFQRGDVEVFLSSDAGSKGINLQAASYVVNFEVPLTYANYVQRINRAHRIDSTHESVVCQSFIASHERFRTIEESIAQMVLHRNQWSDDLLEDDDTGDDFISAADRKTMLSLAKQRQ